MTLRFEFATAARIIFGAGAVKDIGSLAAAIGRHVFVIGGVQQERAAPLLTILEGHGLRVDYFPIDGEPTVEMVERGAEQARLLDTHVVIGYGGGSAIDAGKAIATFVTNTGDIRDYLEVIGKDKPITAPPLPYFAVPTTAGTGAEVTRNAVLAAPEQRVKVSVRSPLMLPRLALIDPELTRDLPPAVTASTGMDALTQLIEPYVTPAANPLTDAICREGLTHVRALRDAYDTGALPAREHMSLAALFGGLALANAKLGAVHGFAGPLGGMFPIPHGAACARLLPIVMKVNLRALRERDPANPALGRYEEAARILIGSPHADADDGARYISELAAALDIPPLSEFGVTAADFPTIVEKSARASSMKGNPITLTDAELTEILQQAL